MKPKTDAQRITICARIMGFVEVRGALARSWYKEDEFKYTFANYFPPTKIEQALEALIERNKQVPCQEKIGFHMHPSGGVDLEVYDDKEGWISVALPPNLKDCAHKIVETICEMEVKG